VFVIFGKVRGRYFLEDLGVGGRMIFARVCSGFQWPVAGEEDS
jgi:hypothetical protein